MILNRLNFKIKLLLFPIALALILGSCKNSFNDIYSYDPSSGYYYHLISYESDLKENKQDKLYRVFLSFENQKDSIFWDSYNNYKNSFVFKMDSISNSNLLAKALYRFNTNDSGAILIRTEQFFKQQFNSNKVPFFCKNDTVVKVNFKIREQLSVQEFLNLQQELLRKEYIQILQFLGDSYDEEKHLDSLGFYWITKPQISDTVIIKQGNHVTINYEGTFLNGRFLEKSPAKFEFVYGNPDQILKGLNYVIQRLKIGQSAKIILPSRLAFGETGSANGTVPPFTPLVYTVKLIEIKK